MNPKTKPARVLALVTAAGMGTRLGQDCPKALVPIAGRPMILRALDTMNQLAGQCPLEAVALTVPENWLTEFQACLKNQNFYFEVLIVPGGRTRQASVATGLQALWSWVQDRPENSGLGRETGENQVLIHDAARPFTPPEVFLRVIKLLQQGCPAVVPLTAVTDTIRPLNEKISSSLSQALNPNINEVQPVALAPALPRAKLGAVATPQGFNLAQILELHRKYAKYAAEESLAFTDDGALFEAEGQEIFAVLGSARGRKITEPADLTWAQQQILNP